MPNWSACILGVLPGILATWPFSSWVAVGSNLAVPYMTGGWGSRQWGGFQSVQGLRSCDDTVQQG